MPTSAIEYQTNSIQSKIPKIDDKTNLYKEKTKYQLEMYESVKFLNQLLLILYIILFSIIHVLLLVQYIQGVKRDATTDTIWLIVLFFYIYLIYYIESVIYFGVTYLLSLIHGQTYVYQFDQMLLFTDFYSDPGTTDISLYP